LFDFGWADIGRLTSVGCLVAYTQENELKRSRMDCGTKGDSSAVPKQYHCGSLLVRRQDYFGTDTVLEFLQGIFEKIFLEYVSVYDVTGKALATSILKRLEENGICLENTIGQGYDGAWSMRGHLKGASAVNTSIYPRVMYVDCCSHSINLALAIHAS